MRCDSCPSEAVTELTPHDRFDPWPVCGTCLAELERRIAESEADYAAGRVHVVTLDELREMNGLDDD